MDALRLGVIGCGAIGNVHMAAAVKSDLVDLVAVADLRKDALNAAAEKYRPKRSCRDGDELLSDPEVEAVVLALPTSGRTRLALRAFERGKHVLTEKPVAMNAAETQEMINARGDLVAACCSARYRFLPSARAASDLIGSGALGNLRVVHCRAFAAAGPPPQKPRPLWRLSKAQSGGGILMNLGCYDLDYLLGLTGWTLKPKTALAQTWTVPPQFASHVAPGSDAETHYVALILCEGGTVISLERGEYMPARTENAWQIVGTKGSLRLCMTLGENVSIVHDDTTEESGVISKTILEGKQNSEPRCAGLIEDLALAIREGRPPMTSLEQALVVQKIFDAIYASAEQGKAVEIG